MFNIKQFLGNLLPTLQRFSLALSFCLIFTILCILSIDTATTNKNFNTLLLFFGVGAVILAALRLWTEEWQSQPRRIATYILVSAIWAVLAWYHANNTNGMLYALPVMLVIPFVALATLPFIRQHEDLPMYNFTNTVFFSLLSSFLITSIVAAALELLVSSFDYLFSIHVNTHCYIYIAIVSYALMLPLTFFTLLPTKEQKYNNTAMFDPKSTGVILYIFIPLLAVYILTLYIYLLKIIWAWELPNGWVSTLVTCCMGGMIAIFWFIHPMAYGKKEKLTDRIYRSIPALMFPLLLLMSIAIGRRIGDYGITAPRIYLLVFNIWCYIVCIVSLLQKKKRIAYIPISFSIIAVLMSVGPQNTTNLINKYMYFSIKKSMEKAGFTQFPLSEKNCKAWIESQDSTNLVLMKSRMDYLIKQDPDLVAELYLYKALPICTQTTKADQKDDLQIYYVPKSNNVQIPAGYHRLTTPTSVQGISKRKDDRYDITINYLDADNHEKAETFILDVKLFKKTSSSPIALTNKQSVLYVTKLIVDVDQSSVIDGYLLFR